MVKPEIVELLLNNGANVNVCEHDGYTPLSRAAMNGHAGIVAMLLAKGADPSVQTKHGHTALTLAVEKRHGGVVSLLESART